MPHCPGTWGSVVTMSCHVVTSLLDFPQRRGCWWLPVEVSRREVWSCQCPILLPLHHSRVLPRGGGIQEVRAWTLPEMLGAVLSTMGGGNITTICSLVSLLLAPLPLWVPGHLPCLVTPMICPCRSTTTTSFTSAHEFSLKSGESFPAFASCRT